MTPLEAAHLYVGNGLSVIPIKADGSKSPCLKVWNPYRERLPTETELVDWFAAGTCGPAVVCGTVSRNLEVLDIDRPDIWEWFWDRHKETLQRESVPVVLTPRGGAHVYLFGDLAGPNRKVARTKDKKTLVEIKGEGGYVLAPGCPGKCHPSGQPYQWLSPLAPDPAMA
jgi:hypothetical protein